MKNMKQRVISGAMAGVLAVSLAVPAFAAGKSTKVTGTYKDIPISVVVPTTGTVTINPYGLPVNVEKSDGKLVAFSGQQITSAPMAIKNQGSVSLAVGASVTGALKTGSTMTLAAATTKGDSSASPAVPAATTKTAFVKLQVAGLSGNTWKVADDDALADKIIEEAAKNATWTAAQDGPVVELGKTNNSDPDTPLATLLPAVMDPTTGEFSTYNGTTSGSSIALFRLSGDCVTAPKKGTGDAATADPWTSKDGFDTTIAFTFTPSANP